jgi:Protein of unknown function (DUF4199)
MKRTVWTFGLISGAVVSVMMVAVLPFQDAIGFDRGAVIGYTTMVLAFLMIFFGVRSYRDNVGRGTISFGRAMAIGTLITIVTTVCYTATWELIYYKLSPGFSEKYAAHEVEQVRTGGGSQAQIDAKIAEMKKFSEMYQNPLFNAAVTMLEPLPVGLVIALVSAGILRRPRRQAQDGEQVLAAT